MKTIERGLPPAMPEMDVYRDRHRRWVIALGNKRKVTRRRRTMRRWILRVNAKRRWPR